MGHVQREEFDGKHLKLFFNKKTCFDLYQNMIYFLIRSVKVDPPDWDMNIHVI